MCSGPNCGRELVWVRTVSGAKMPLDAKPVKVLIKARGHLSSPVYTMMTAWTPHWATCADRETFKKPRESNHR